jgi:hypothetical protein
LFGDGSAHFDDFADLDARFTQLPDPLIGRLSDMDGVSSRTGGFAGTFRYFAN